MLCSALSHRPTTSALSNQPDRRRHRTLPMMVRMHATTPSCADDDSQALQTRWAERGVGQLRLLVSKSSHGAKARARAQLASAQRT
eukprot:5994313-Pleurochrysis_carterae.AAC.3